MDDFTDAMIVTGLELSLSSKDKTAMSQLLTFLWDFDRLSKPISDKVLHKITKECSPPVLSRLFLECHVILIATHYGLREEDAICADYELHPVLDGVLNSLMPPLRQLLSSDASIAKNMEILCEIFWILLLAQRYEMHGVLPPDYVDELFPKLCAALDRYYQFTMKKEDCASLRKVAHESQLWLLCAKELKKLSAVSGSKPLVSRTVPSRTSPRSSNPEEKKIGQGVPPPPPPPPGSPQVSAACCSCSETQCQTTSCPCFLAGEKCKNCAPKDDNCLNPRGCSPVLSQKKAARQREEEHAKLYNDLQTKLRQAESQARKAERAKRKAEDERQKAEAEKKLLQKDQRKKARLAQREADEAKRAKDARKEVRKRKREEKAADDAAKLLRKKTKPVKQPQQAMELDPAANRLPPEITAALSALPQITARLSAIPEITASVTKLEQDREEKRNQRELLYEISRLTQPQVPQQSLTFGQLGLNQLGLAQLGLGQMGQLVYDPRR